jgi:hypothetical protein
MRNLVGGKSDTEWGLAGVNTNRPARDIKTNRPARTQTILSMERVV